MTPLQEFQYKAETTPDGILGRKTLKAGAVFLGITPMQAVHFFAQCSHETAGFRHFKENLNYSASTLLRVFGKYFDEYEAEEYERQPEAIANIVYANRLGNIQSGDGWKYRGRGAIQLTGKKNYKNFSKYAGVNFIDYPDRVADQFAFESALFFFETNNLFDLCIDTEPYTVKKLTRRINGGYNGLKHRIELTQKYATYI